MERPLRRWPDGVAPLRHALMLALAVLLSGCLGGLQPSGLQSFGKGQASDDPESLSAFAPECSTATFPVVQNLRARRSVLPPEGSYAAVAQAVVLASSGASAAELRMARFQKDAVDKNWLPQIGPVVTLDSLGVLAAQIVAEQALLDNGRRKAERAVAAADVEVAAVSLAEDMNERVRQGLELYIGAEQARAQAAVASRGVERLAAYQDMVEQRVAGGLSDRSESQIVGQKRAEMQAIYAGDMQSAERSLGDLAALAGRPLAGLRGLDRLNVADGVPLSVLRAKSEGARKLAMARAGRAGLLPGLTATASLDDGGAFKPGLRLGGATFGWGTGARMRALDATPDLVDKQVAEAGQDAQRRLTALAGEIAELRLRQAQGDGVLEQTLANLDLLGEQYMAGLRSLVELVAQYDAAVRLERDQAAVSYEIARREIEAAALRGQLTGGAAM